MFRTQVNGGIDECCEIMVDGIEFSRDLNTGAKINACIDIVNVLNKKYQKKMPLFVDNCESLNSVLESKNQLITLTVTEDRELTVEDIQGEKK